MKTTADLTSEDMAVIFAVRKEYCPNHGWEAVDHESERTTVLACGRVLVNRP